MRKIKGKMRSSEMEFSEKQRQTCCFTGHRYISQKERKSLEYRLNKVILHLYKQKVLYYGAGGALGFDYEKRKVMRSEVLDMA